MVSSLVCQVFEGDLLDIERAFLCYFFYTTAPRASGVEDHTSLHRLLCCVDLDKLQLELPVRLGVCVVKRDFERSAVNRDFGGVFDRLGQRQIAGLPVKAFNISC